ncbi:MAG TPA: hypothetical protein VLA89_15910 [Gemmatimonadales bacterium]|nr:hypothetical protein [Gemmatimonadales bacterium]
MIETKEGVKIKIGRAPYDPKRIQVEYFGPQSMYRQVFLTWEEADEVTKKLLEMAHEAYMADER